MSTRLIKAPLAVLLVAAMTGACTPARPDAPFRVPTQPRGLTCDTATGTVVAFGLSTAQLYANMALKHQESDLRGYMFNSGLRRIRVVQRSNTCATFDAPASPSNLYECKARAQLCGR
jgi:hypothetical protein